MKSEPTLVIWRSALPTWDPLPDTEDTEILVDGNLLPLDMLVADIGEPDYRLTAILEGVNNGSV